MIMRFKKHLKFLIFLLLIVQLCNICYIATAKHLALTEPFPENKLKTKAVIIKTATDNYREDITYHQKVIVKDKPEAKRILIMTVTAYCHSRYRTASRTKPCPGTISVDPKIIPLGTALYVEGYGQGRALDTGSAIKGNRIDVWFTSREEAVRWGKKKVKVYIYGGW